MEPGAFGYNWATMFSGGYKSKYKDLAVQFGGVSKLSPAGLGPENDCAGKDQQQL
jgi:hypothetical protein